MLKSIEVQGRTEDEAIELALEQLGLSRDDVSVEILETAKKGLLGIKNTPATIKVEYEADDEPDTSATSADARISDALSLSDSKPSKKTRAAASAQSSPVDSEIGDKIESYLKGLFERMDLDVSFDMSERDGAVNVNLKSTDPGVLIGRRGETLDALQHLTNYSVNRTPAGRTRIQLDAENYRQRRSEALENLALRTASKVVKYRRNMTLDPMNAYERHIVHTALQDHGQVSTFSIGNESNRRVVIAYGQGKTASDRTENPQYKEWH